MSARSRPAPAPIAAGGRPLRWWIPALARLLRGFYFSRVRIVGARQQPSPRRGGRLIVSSHRNGAIDGYTVLRAFPGVQGLVSIQLLSHPLLRWMFDGIAVVREKDRERHGVRRGAFANPVDAGCAQLRAGGDLVIFPEGSSEWGWQPLPYQRGAARIARTLLAEDASLEVVPLGLHYQAPDRFRSRVEVLVGAPVALPAREADEADRDWERRIHQAIAAALDAVSVNCADADSFAAAEAEATARAAAGEPYALAFIDAQHHPQARPAPPRLRIRAWPWDWLAVAAFMLLAAPVLLVGRFAGGKADARNTVSFFRIVGGLVAAVLWLPCLLLATWLWPAPLLALWLLAALGWWRWPHVMHRDNP
ncbi:MAG: 1-acyl-sn-glycerol-3-phosphate acyltransferase [Rhodanobacter sp.]